MSEKNGVQISLTPAESKKFISKSILNIDFFRRALEKSLVVIHPSSTTYFLYEELTQRKPRNWVCGVIVQKGACINDDLFNVLASKGVIGDIGKFSQFWVFRNGKLVEKSPTLNEIIEEMDSDCVYVKTGNALDAGGNVGVLIGAPDGRGTVGRFYEASKRIGFKVLLPIGLEKLIHSVKKAAETANPERLIYSMGMPASLLPIQGFTITECEAVNLLADLKATLISSGGLSGAEGSVTLFVEGNKENSEKLLKILKEVKGAKLPRIKNPKCEKCSWKTCFKYEAKNIAGTLSEKYG